MDRLRPYFPKSRGRARVDDRRVLSGIIFINLNGLRWLGASLEYSLPKTLYNRWKRWNDMGVFARIMMGLAEQAPDNKTISIDATYLKAHRTASRLGLKNGAWASDRADQGRHEHKATCRYRYSWTSSPVLYHSRSGSDCTGAAALMNSLPEADWSLADRGYDADWFREDRIDKGIRHCILGRKSRKMTIK